MKEKIQKALELFDLSGGIILGLWSLTYLAAFIASMVLLCRNGTVVDVPAGWKEIYNWILTAFAASKTLRTIFGKATDSNEKPS